MIVQEREKVRRLEYRPYTVTAFQPGGALPSDAGGAVYGLEKAGVEAKLQELEARESQREMHLAQQLEEARRQGFEQGIKHGRSLSEAEQKDHIRASMERFERLMHEFEGAREQYFSRVEQEVVRLALAIAARILHRETQMDPLLLSGAVRVALNQLSETTRARLHVPVREEAMWTDIIRLLPNLRSQPEVAGDESLTAGECLLEIATGSVNLGVRAQLEEIEKGFFDLLGARNSTNAQIQPPGAAARAE